MSDFARDWRPSANLQFAPPQDQLRRRWLLDAVDQPDEMRAARGAPVLSLEQKTGLNNLIGSESQFAAPGENWLGDRRTPAPPALGRDPNGLPGLALDTLGTVRPLEQQPFMARNDDAMSNAAIGDLLSGRGGQPNPFSGALDQVGGMTPLGRLGVAYPLGGRR